MKNNIKVFEFNGKPGRVLVYSFLVTIFALFLTYSAVMLIVRKEVQKRNLHEVTVSEQVPGV